MASFFNRKTGIALGLVLVFGAAAAYTATMKSNSSTGTPGKVHTTLPQAIKGTPLFSFDAGKAPDWKQGPTDKVSMALFKKDTHCFTSVELKSGAVDEATELSKIAAAFSEQGYGATASSSINTTFSVTGASPSGVPYTLHPYAISGTGEGGYKTQAFGYVPLEHQYIKVQARCSDDTTVPQMNEALLALTLKSQN